MFIWGKIVLILILVRVTFGACSGTATHRFYFPPPVVLRVFCNVVFFGFLFFFFFLVFVFLYKNHSPGEDCLTESRIRRRQGGKVVQNPETRRSDLSLQSFSFQILGQRRRDWRVYETNKLRALLTVHSSTGAGRPPCLLVCGCSFSWVLLGQTQRISVVYSLSANPFTK